MPPCWVEISWLSDVTDFESCQYQSQPDIDLGRGVYQQDSQKIHHLCWFQCSALRLPFASFCRRNGWGLLTSTWLMKKLKCWWFHWWVHWWVKCRIEMIASCASNMPVLPGIRQAEVLLLSHLQATAQLGSLPILVSDAQVAHLLVGWNSLILASGIVMVDANAMLPLFPCCHDGSISA